MAVRQIKRNEETVVDSKQTKKIREVPSENVETPVKKPRKKREFKADSLEKVVDVINASNNLACQLSIIGDMTTQEEIDNDNIRVLLKVIRDVQNDLENYILLITCLRSKIYVSAFIANAKEVRQKLDEYWATLINNF